MITATPICRNAPPLTNPISYTWDWLLEFANLFTGGELVLLYFSVGLVLGVIFSAIHIIIEWTVGDLDRDSATSVYIILGAMLLAWPAGAILAAGLVIHFTWMRIFGTLAYTQRKRP